LLLYGYDRERDRETYVITSHNTADNGVWAIFSQAPPPVKSDRGGGFCPFAPVAFDRGGASL